MEGFKVTFRKIAVVLIAALLLFNLIYSLAHLKDEQAFYTYPTQAMYNSAFFEEGRYPDLFIRALVRDKTVILPREIKTYSEYSTYGRDEEDGNPFDNNYLIENDYIRYFDCFAAKTITDTSLPSMGETAQLFEGREDFESLGIANDMLRYSFPLNHEEVQQARGFWYFWYYHHFADKEPDRPESFPEVFVHLPSLENTDTVLALWDENENLYLCAPEVIAE